MKRSYRRKFVIVVVITLAAILYAYQTSTSPWETITTTFLKTDKPYGGGDFRIHGNEVISVKSAGPTLLFKPLAIYRAMDG